MKEREEKQRKFHETLLNILYHQQTNSPSSSSPSLKEDVLEAEPPSSLPLEKGTAILLDGFDDLEEKEKSSSSSSESNECGNNSEKLTRAQRKKLRKKKLKEASSRRQNIIGPLLPPSTANGSSSIIEVVHQDQLQEPLSTSNVVEESKGSNVGNLNQGSGSVQNKLKHRRTAKRRKQQVVVDAVCQVHSSCSNANEETIDNNRALGNEET